MVDVPAKYLLHLYDNDLCNGKVKRYIEFNIKELREESMLY
jgi:uncharacterized protein (DUF3820 family)